MLTTNRNVMRKIVLLLTLGGVLCGLYSCGSKTDAGKERKGDSKVEPASPYRFVDVLPVKSTPFVDSTSFDSYEMKEKLTSEQVALLHLDKIVSKDDFLSTTSFALRYRVNLSSQFQTVVVSYLPNENELYTLLVNYDRNFHVIDFYQIAYDEIAENFLRTESTISKDGIVVTDLECTTGTDVTKVTTYRVAASGKIRASR